MEPILAQIIELMDRFAFGKLGTHKTLLQCSLFLLGFIAEIIQCFYAVPLNNINFFLYTGFNAICIVNQENADIAVLQIITIMCACRY